MRRLTAATAVARAQIMGMAWGVGVPWRVKIARGVTFDLEPGARLSLGRDVYLAEGVHLHVASGARLTVGERVFIGHHSVIMCKKEIKIGDGAALAEGVGVRDHDHVVGMPPTTGGLTMGPVFVGRDVWLAAHVTITRGCTIGDASVVAANAVVTRDVPARTLVGGVPARILRELHASG